MTKHMVFHIGDQVMIQGIDFNQLEMLGNILSTVDTDAQG